MKWAWWEKGRAVAGRFGRTLVGRVEPWIVGLVVVVPEGWEKGRAAVGRFGCLQVGCFGLWVAGLLILFFVVLPAPDKPLLPPEAVPTVKAPAPGADKAPGPEPSPKPAADPAERGDLKVYSSHHASSQYRRLEKSAAFGLEQLRATVNYLLLAAAGVLAFITKTVMDFRMEWAKNPTNDARRPGRFPCNLLIDGGLACLFSLISGVITYFAFPSIAVEDTFDVSGTLSTLILAQAAALLVGVGFVMLALVCLLYDLLPERGVP